MTVGLNQAGSAHVPEQGTVVEANAGPDPLLLDLVRVANYYARAEDVEVDIGLTLHVSGVVVSGDLISYDSYLKALAARLREDGPPECRAEREAFARVIDGGRGISTDPADREGGAAPPYYIHLRAAVIHSPGGPGRLPRTLWRGRLSHVSAWSLGRLEEEG
jgi:hypothetical protein